MNGHCLSWETLTLRLRHPFRLAHGVSETRQSFWIRLHDDSGWGEGTIPPYYGVDSSRMIECWDRAACLTLPFPENIDEIPHWLPEGPAPARAALEMALIDRIAKRRGMPLHQLLGIPAATNLTTSFTIAIDTPDNMARMATAMSDYPILKLKLGSDDDESRVAAVRQARPNVKIRVDANAGWAFDQAVTHLQWLGKYDIELIEQPLASDQIQAMGELQGRTSIPIVADESVQTIDDIDQLARAEIRGVNLKLMKAGGIIAAHRMLNHAREVGIKVMLGSMIETSLGTTAMAHLAGAADWIDLDAPLLISNDPFGGIQYDRNARVSIPNRPGIGVMKKEGAS
ncbi:MAG TPA: dipeptide epimerase [Tepidisphaeraceae bacterium]|jgi:L-alanine-DL-glutamate epimerase-like enolase superfamily enzyme|nr:dipeptide epimerase [Tepidisphaeraceae bacterium]